jgi:pimeloyl-ACP methyl ester carboxylesterase
MTKLRTLAAMAAGVLTATFGGFEAHAQSVAPVEARNVVLIHGAWADGSSWAEVIPRLQVAGLKVTAVQNPLTTLADSVADTRRVLAQHDGPTVLVAHSWGGTVLSEAGTDPKLTALVYVAARAPDAGEDFVALSGKFPAGPVRQASSSMTVSPQFRRRRFLNPSRMVSSPKRQKSFMPCSGRRPPLCSANGPRRPPGTPNRHGMPFQNSTRQSIRTWSDFWQNA